MDELKGVNPVWKKLVGMKNRVYQKAFRLRVMMSPAIQAKQLPNEPLPVEAIFGDRRV
jgi:hypothetical protein